MSNQEDPIARRLGVEALLVGMMQGDTKGVIEAQERGEQARVCGNGSTVEIARDFGYGEQAVIKRQKLEEMGVVFLESDKTPYRDPVLQRVQLPDGWKLVPTDHHMWSHLVDADGNKRADCGYKGAFYDRWAQINLCVRYRTDMEYGKWPEKGPAPTRGYVVDTKTGTELFTTEMSTVRFDDDSKRTACIDFLNERFPDWTNPNAYWNS